MTDKAEIPENAHDAMAKIVRAIAAEHRVKITSAHFEWLERMDGTMHLVGVQFLSDKKV